MAKKIRIVIADDHAVLRAGIRVLLELQADFEVVGEAASGQEAIQRVRETAPDVVIMDIGMPGLDGMTATRQIKAEAPQTRILFLTQHENKEYVLPGLKMGASGYVLKRSEGDELITAIRTIYTGGIFIDPAIAGVVIEGLRDAEKLNDDPWNTLSDREREVCLLLAQGMTYQQIADILFISPKTVDYHRTNIFRKLGVSSRTELTRYAAQRGLIP